MRFRPRRDLMVAVSGLPVGANREEEAVYRAKLHEASSTFLRRSGLEAIDVRVSAGRHGETSARTAVDQQPHEKPGRAAVQQFVATAPRLEPTELVVPVDVHDRLRLVCTMVRNQQTLSRWGLHAKPVVNFVGSPGVGKTHAAHRIAADVGKPIISVTYAALEGMYVGEGARNVEALFSAAVAQKAVTLIDESESALSTRMLARQGSEQAANSIKTKLLTTIGRHPEPVIFATNRFEDYDPAFVSRITMTVHFPAPDEACRARLWELHLRAVPLAADVDVVDLAAVGKALVGRSIAQAAAMAAVIALDNGRCVVQRQDLLNAMRLIDCSCHQDEPAGYRE